MTYNQLRKPLLEAGEDKWKSGVSAPLIRNLSTGLRQVISFTHQPLYPSKNTHVTHLIGGSVGSASILDALGNQQISST